jgi:hypothetical protein
MLATSVGVDVETFVKKTVQGHAALRMSDASTRAQCRYSEKRLFHRIISREPLIFLYKANIFGTSGPCYLTSREVAGNVAKGILRKKKKQVVQKAAVSFTQHGLELKISH